MLQIEPEADIEAQISPFLSDQNNSIPNIGSENIEYAKNFLDCFDFQPTLRSGTICNIIRSNRRKVDRLKSHMMNDSYWSSIINKIELNPKEYYCSDIERTSNKLALEHQEGIVIKFPMFRAKIDNEIWVEVRCSNTICIKPNFSKIWIGITFDNEYSKLSISINEFFNIATKIADRIRDDIFNKYKDALVELELTDSLDKIYMVSIETVAEPLTEIYSDIKSCQFSFKNDFNKAIKLNSIKWILNTSYNIPSDTKGNIYEGYSKLFNNTTDEWIGSILHGKDELAGLYLKQHLPGNETRFRGVVHTPIDLPKLNAKTRPLIFSRDLIRNISPFIKSVGK